MDTGLQPQSLVTEANQQPVTDSGDQSTTPPPLSGASGEQAEEKPQVTALQNVAGQTTGHPAPVKDEHVFDAQDYNPNVMGHNTPPTVPELPKPKLTETEILRERLKRDPLDASAHQRLIGLAEASGDVEKIQDAYEGLLEAFPNAVCLVNFNQAISHLFYRPQHKLPI
jgi:hypothetical protein